MYFVSTQLKMSPYNLHVQQNKYLNIKNNYYVKLIALASTQLWTMTIFTNYQVSAKMRHFQIIKLINYIYLHYSDGFLKKCINNRSKNILKTGFQAF